MSGIKPLSDQIATALRPICIKPAWVEDCLENLAVKGVNVLGMDSSKLTKQVYEHVMHNDIRGWAESSKLPLNISSGTCSHIDGPILL